MFLKSIKRNQKIGTRIILWSTLILLFSILSVSGTVYYLLSTSLRENDRLLIEGKGQDLQRAYEKGGLKNLEDYINTQDFSKEDNEIFVSIINGERKVIQTFMPMFLDKDYEDEEELHQIQEDATKLKLKKGWQNILILSGDERKNILKEGEFELRKIALKKKWDSILPLIDNDLFEVYTLSLGDNLWMQIGKSSEEREEQLAKIRNISLVVVIPFILLGIFFSFLLSRGILKPIRRIIETIAEIESGDTKARVPLSMNGDEIDQLSEKFNKLMESNQNLIQSMKATLDNVAHDLRTPLTRFRMGAELSLSKEGNQMEMKESLADAIESADRMSGLLKAIMDMAEAESGTMKLNLERINILEFFQQLKDLYQFVAEEKNIKINLSISPELFMKGDQIRLSQAMGNLIDNAIKYSLPGSTVEISADYLDRRIIIAIEDHGIGIPLQDLPKIWQRLYRVDQSRSTPGLGIGLSVVKAIVMAHQGEISVVSEQGQGSTFIISLR